MSESFELAACTPEPVLSDGFNEQAIIPYGCHVAHIRSAMQEFIDFLGYINLQLHTKNLSRLETMLMPANFSSFVGEFMSASIPKYCPTLVKNRYHNGHPDFIPVSIFPEDRVQHSDQGIEIKASRYLRGWQGHNPENIWLMIFVFDSNRPADETNGILPKPFRFVMVAGAKLAITDWQFSGRSAESRRTITASVTQSGYQKITENWIYKAPG